MKRAREKYKEGDPTHHNEKNNNKGLLLKLIISVFHY